MLEAPTEGADVDEIAPVWYILAGDRILRDDEGFEVLDRNLVPLGNEVGFCLNFKGRGSAECTRQFFRWNDEVTRIYYREENQS